jgi:hypothetical protein
VADVSGSSHELKAYQLKEGPTGAVDPHFEQRRMDLTTGLLHDLNAWDQLGAEAGRSGDPKRATFKRTADKCARLYRPAALVALRRGRETYVTAAQPLSYVGPEGEYV